MGAEGEVVAFDRVGAVSAGIVNFAVNDIAVVFQPVGADAFGLR